jgi:hypothetical protein
VFLEVFVRAVILLWGFMILAAMIIMPPVMLYLLLDFIGGLV